MLDNFSFYMKANLEKYSGEWVAIVDEKIAAHGKNAKEVYEKAKNNTQIKLPFLLAFLKKLR